MPLSLTVDDTQQIELAVRLGIVFRNCGIGFMKLTNFFYWTKRPATDAPQDLSKHCNGNARRSHASSLNVMKEEARMVRKAQGTNPDGDEALQDVPFSYNGTCNKRGHTSHFGIGVAIELKTGLILDYAVVTNYCHGCRIGPQRGIRRLQRVAGKTPI